MTFTLTHPREEDPNYQVFMGLVGTLKGLPNWSAPIDHIAFDSDARFAHVTRNLGTGGHHIWRKSTDNSQVVAITDASLAATTVAATGAITGFSLAVNTSVVAGTSVAAGTTITSGGLATLNSLAVTNNATVGGTLGVTGAITGSSTVQGTRLISTIATGTAPLTVASTTMVTNLNAEFVGGQNLAGLDTRYVNATGDTMTGALNIQAASALKLQGVSGLGGWVLNATNIADPVLEFRDNSGDLLAAMNPSGSTYAIDVNNGTPATNAARFSGDVLITTDLGVRTVNATTNVTAAKIVAGGTTFSGSEKLRVVSGTSRLEGDVAMTAGTLTLSSGNIDVQSGTAGEMRVGAMIVNAASLAGSEKLRVGGQALLTYDSDVQLVLKGSGSANGMYMYETDGSTLAVFAGALTGTDQYRVNAVPSGYGIEFLTQSTIRQRMTAAGTAFGAGLDFASGTGVIYITNRTGAPSGTPSGGGVLYSESGAGKWKGTSGTVTTFGPADPHCPVCDRDFSLEWESEKYGHLVVCMFCLTKGNKKGVIKRDPGSLGE